MKTVNKAFWILAMVFGLASVALFFMPFAEIATESGNISLVGTELAFGSKVEIAGSEVDLSMSSNILFCICLTALAFLMSIFSIKTKRLRYATPVVSLISTVYMFVVAFSAAGKYVDYRPIENITKVGYAPFVVFIPIALAVFTIFAAAYLFLDDYLEVLASNGAKRTILKRVIHFFRDYKSETKKIVWPGLKDVVKNTIIVLIMCLIVGVLIWVVDFGLAKLLDLLWGI